MHPLGGQHVLPRVLRAFAVAQPEVQVHVMDESARQVLDAVMQGAADFGLSFTGSQESALRFEALIRERYVLAMPRSHRWAKRKGIAWAELAGQRLVSVSRDSANRLLLDQATADLADPPVTWYECNHVAGALAMVEGGLGLAVLPQLALPPQHSEPPRESWRPFGLSQASTMEG